MKRTESMKEDWITFQGKTKLSDMKLSKLMYAIVICKVELVKTHGVGIYNYNKRQNCHNSFDFIISIHKDMVDKFKFMTELKLSEPITIYPS